MSEKVRIAHLAGPQATIQNTPPLVTSNKARARHGLPPRPPDAGRAVPLRRAPRPASGGVRDSLCRAVPGSSAEADAAELYGPPDGYIGADGVFRAEPQSDDDKPVYEIEIRPEDGLYPLPYMARQANGEAWEEECARPGAPGEGARQGFSPTARRTSSTRCATSHCASGPTAMAATAAARWSSRNSRSSPAAMSPRPMPGRAGTSRPAVTAGSSARFTIPAGSCRPTCRSTGTFGIRR